MATDVVEEVGSVDDFLAHYGVKGMRWGKRSAGRALADSSFGKLSKKNADAHNARVSARANKKTKGDKPVSAGKQRDMDIKAARSRLNEGKSVVGRMMNRDSFGKPIGGRQMLSLMNPTKSPEDVALAASMTRGQKATLGIATGLAVAGLAIQAANR